MLISDGQHVLGYVLWENQCVIYSQYCSYKGIHTTKALSAQVKWIRKDLEGGSYKECDVTRVEDQSNYLLVAGTEWSC